MTNDSGSRQGRGEVEGLGGYESIFPRLQLMPDIQKLLLTDQERKSHSWCWLFKILFASNLFS